MEVEELADNDHRRRRMGSKKATIIALAAAAAVLAATEIALYVCFHLTRPFYLSTAVILSAALASAVVALLLHLMGSGGRRAESMARRRALDGEELRMEYSYFRKVAGLPSKFSLETLAAATDNFQSVAGRGSSGTVFRGILDDGTAVAVKRIDGAEQHVDREFTAEVSAIAAAHHANLVRLLGFCLVPRFLVYEFMEHGSLDRWIFPAHRCLPWTARYRVAVDVAKALAYMHHDLRAKVLHLDVKPENILLDGGFRGLLADFGMSKLVAKEQSRVMTTVRGTTGYLAPEWLLGVGITEKSDVYSYGMVLLELVGGRRCLKPEEPQDGGEGSSSRRWSYLPKIAAEMARDDRLEEIVDRRIADAADASEVRRAVHVALWCAQEKAAARPTMARVAEMLEGRGHVDAPPPSEMIVVDLLAIDYHDGHHHYHPRNGGGGPFGLGSSTADDLRAASSALSGNESFARSYLSGR